MNEYINIRDAVDNLTRVFRALYGAFYPTVVIDEVVKKALSEVPTVELVRCRDCVNWDTDWTPTRADPGEHWCPITDLIKPGNWFCANGERKEEDE